MMPHRMRQGRSYAGVAIIDKPDPQWTKLKPMQWAKTVDTQHDFYFFLYVIFFMALFCVASRSTWTVRKSSNLLRLDFVMI
jgi:hypothetical protein